MRTLAGWLRLQQHAHPRSIDLGLVRVRRVACALGLERAQVPTFTVGGTNGKGSTVALLDAMLRAAGLSTGAFSSAASRALQRAHPRRRHRGLR